MTNSNRKGKNGERELANKLCDYELTAKRGQQHKGGPDSADVEVEEWDKLIHIECKRTKKLRLYPAMKQAIFDCALTDKIPTVIHRGDSEEWIAITRLSDFVRMANCTLAQDYYFERTTYWKDRADAAELTLAEHGLEAKG